MNGSGVFGCAAFSARVSSESGRLERSIKINEGDVPGVASKAMSAHLSPTPRYANDHRVFLAVDPVFVGDELTVDLDAADAGVGRHAEGELKPAACAAQRTVHGHRFARGVHFARADGEDRRIEF